VQFSTAEIPSTEPLSPENQGRAWDKLPNWVAHPLRFGFSRGAVCNFVFFLVRHARSARAAERLLHHRNQGAQGRIDGLLVREILSNVR
jgi:hypothetical protein